MESSSRSLLFEGPQQVPHRNLHKYYLEVIAMFKGKSLFVTVFLFALMLSPLSQANATKGKTPAAPAAIAKIDVGLYQIEWHPLVDYAQIVLTISGPENFSSNEAFVGSEIPSLTYYDASKGSLLPDGLYTYELVVLPLLEDDVIKTLESLSDSPDREAVVQELKQAGLIPDSVVGQSGSFTLKDGVALVAVAAEGKVAEGQDTDDPSAAKHFIGVGGNNSIDGSLSVGFDSVAEEAFGFDTLRLKENNLRLDFQDTSNTARFPPNDWRIIINDSSNGGASHFTVEDRSAGNNVFRIFAGARNNALVVDSQGDLGLGTTTPAVDIDIKTGNTPTVRLQQDGTAGFTPQTWDMAGNETNWFLRDATNGSTLPIRVRPGADSNSLYIDTDNEIGLGTASPQAQLHVRHDDDTVGDAQFRVENTDGSDDTDNVVILNNGDVGIGTISPETRLHIFDGESGQSPNSTNGICLEDGGDQFIHFLSSGAANQFINFGDPGAANRGYIRYDHSTDKLHLRAASNTNNMVLTGTRVGIGLDNPSTIIEVAGGANCDGTSWNNVSSRESKKNIESLTERDLEGLFEVLDEVEIVQFQYNQESDDASRRVGMIAEDMPDPLASEDHKHLDLGRHVGFLMGVVKAMNEDRKEMAAEISQLRRDIENLSDSEK